MNGKSIRKRLMRRRDGYRAYITVRLSMREFGLIEPPDVVFPGMVKLEDFRGEWDALDGRSRISIGPVSSADYPCADDSAPYERPVFVETDSVGWSWWEGVQSTTLESGAIAREPVDEAAIGQHRARRLWFDALDTTEHPILRQFAQAASWCGGNLWEVEGDDLFITYTVKWKRFYGDRKLRLSAALSRAMKAAKRAGLKALVVKP